MKPRTWLKVLPAMFNAGRSELLPYFFSLFFA